MEMMSQHRQYHQMLQRCEDWLKDPFADEDAEGFDFEDPAVSNGFAWKSHIPKIALLNVMKHTKIKIDEVVN